MDIDLVMIRSLTHSDCKPDRSLYIRLIDLRFPTGCNILLPQDTIKRMKQRSYKSCPKLIPYVPKCAYPAYILVCR